MKDFDKITEYVQKKTYSYDGSHDFEHALRVAWNAYRICTRSRLRGLCTVVALTHDTCDGKYVVDKEVCLLELENFLTPLLGIEQARTAKDVVREISFSKLRRVGPPTHLLQDAFYVWSVVADADMLEAMGCIGVMRTIMFQGSNNQSLDDAINYASTHLTRCVCYMNHPIAIEEANLRRTAMIEILKSMCNHSSDRNFGHYCLSSGSKRDSFNVMMTGLQTKRFWHDAVRCIFEREKVWSASTWPDRKMTVRAS